ncbi:capsule biosynthesis protein [Oceaniglobus indicus]|uniref:capsule biosynthesis protein n=1 Tax=Oceaniglobus indicus TaxID=2047749 RepID=UPI000C1821DC|nr:capsule biosynthesis protein [Oceaniglobus indicus]
MTTKPKVKKFRIRRSSPLATIVAETDKPAAADAAQAPATPRAESSIAKVVDPTPTPTDAPPPRDADTADAADRGRAAQAVRADAAMASGRQADRAAGEPPTPTPAQDASISDADDVRSEDDINALRKEGLTGRQLRMARRLAQKHGLTATSDFDAVRQLRARGIDPFERSSMLELVVPQNEGQTGTSLGESRVQLPQTMDPRQVPSTTVPQPAARPDPVANRIREISDIQRDIARRRRRKSLLLFTRLLFFVGLPTMLAGYYYYVIATPMYATKSEFVIQQSEGGAASGGALGGLFSGTGFATSQDSITVQSYLQSRDVMLRLDGDLGFKTVFSDPSIDAIQRLPDDASNEDAYKLFKKNVEIGYDPSEGIIKMEVVAPDPAISAEWSRKMIEYAEEQIDNLTLRLRGDQMEGALDSFADAEAKMQAAQARVLELQEKLGVFDPTAESGGVMSQITTFEVQLQEKRLQLQQLLDNRRPNQARVDGVRGDIERLENLVSRLRGQLTDGTGDGSSLARVSGELRMAEVDLQTRTLMMQQALQQLETARIEANRQVRYLSVGVSPVPPDEATYPRAFENTLLAALIFSGIYLMCSLTASILREQVSA